MNKQSTEARKRHSTPGRNPDNHPQQDFSHFTEYSVMEAELLCLAVMKADVKQRGNNSDLRLVSARWKSHGNLCIFGDTVLPMKLFTLPERVQEYVHLERDDKHAEILNQIPTVFRV